LPIGADVTFNPISRAKLGVAADDPFFDDDAAAKMYHEISKMDQDEATVLLQMAAFHVAARDLTRYGEVIEAGYNKEIAKRAERVKGTLTRNLISKGKDPAPYLAYLDEISKAVDPITDWDISNRVKRQLRDPGGRFRVMTHKIEPNILDKPIRAGEAQKLGIPKPSRAGGTDKGVRLDDAANKKFQGDYYQVSNLLKTIQNDPITAKGAVVTLNYTDGTTDQFLTTEGQDKLKDKFAGEKYATGNRVASVDLSFLREDNPQIDLMSAMGVPGGGMRNQAINYMSNVNGQDKALVDYGTSMNSYRDTDVLNPADRAYRRLGATANLLSNILPDSAIKTQLALNAAKWAGFNATEVERVIGPGARKVAYRYRGIEKAPNPGLQKTIDAYIAGTKGNKDKARDILINGSNVEMATNNGVRQEFKESPIIQYLVKDLPKKELVNLQTKSGAMPPSRGYIIDRNGKIITEAAGYGDDHYLPFNLKNISKLKGGEYVRTRTLGGPTTEDIYAGLISGARSVTVVSRSGIYTVEFDEAFRGSRRYNDKAARMVGRYGMILDAVKSGDVTLETVPGDRIEELKSEAFRLYPDETSEGYARELNRLKKVEESNPRMSQTRLDETAREFLRTVASRQKTRDGSEMTYDEMVAGLINRDVATQVAEDTAWLGGIQGAPTGTIEANAREMIATKYKNPEAIINTIGLDDEYNKFFETQMKTYKASQAPLRLDGPGYAFALDAMKEQFPYYIKSIKYRQLNQSDADTRRDVGYVKPNFTRPEGVQAGYYDASINGSKKISADRLNYQNLRVVGTYDRSGGQQPVDYNPPANRRAETNNGNEDKNVGFGDTRTPNSNPETKKNSAKDVREMFQKRTATDRNYNSPKFGVVASGSELDVHFKAAFPFTFGMTPTEFDEAWDDNPDMVEASMKREIAQLREFFTLGNSESAKLFAFNNGGNVPIMKYDRLNPPLSEILKGSKFDFGDPLFMPGIESDRIKAKLETDPNLAGAKAKIVGALEAAKMPKEMLTEPTPELVRAIKEIVNQQVKNVQAIKTDQESTGMKVYGPERLTQEANSLADLTKVWQLTDNYVQSVITEAKTARERQMIESGAGSGPRVIGLNVNDEDAMNKIIEAFGLPKNKVIDENGNYVDV